MTIFTIVLVQSSIIKFAKWYYHINIKLKISILYEYKNQPNQ